MVPSFTFEANFNNGTPACVCACVHEKCYYQFCGFAILWGTSNTLGKNEIRKPGILVLVMSACSVENYGQKPAPSKITAAFICEVHGNYGPHVY